jgi:hypothetical protein
MARGFDHIVHEGDGELALFEFAHAAAVGFETAQVPAPRAPAAGWRITRRLGSCVCVFVCLCVRVCACVCMRV